ncbi:MAG: GNAT family N-acetyltransferase [Spirochaetota bacterium]
MSLLERITVDEIGTEKVIIAHDMIKRTFAEFVASDLNNAGKASFLHYIKIEALTGRIKNGESFILAAMDDQNVVGVIEVSEYRYIKLLFVDKNYQGNGIARLLLDEAYRRCKADWHDCSELKVNSSLYAFEIYKKLGFEPAGEKQEKDGVVYIPMERKYI